MIPDRIKEKIAAARRGEIDWDVRQRAKWETVPEPLRHALCDMARVARDVPVKDYTEDERARLYRAANIAHQQHTKVAMGTFVNTFKPSA
ncbi:MAG: hypothetical protein RIS44_3258 [Pseudomonadota bacterium]|jgi:hypothetical protein